MNKQSADIEPMRDWQKAPELGPRILFFSGGTALNEISHKLKLFTHNSIHLVTPFDSGGSSAKLRDCFDMPALGDLRSRMVALASNNTKAGAHIFALCSHRLPTDLSPAPLYHLLNDLADGSHPLMTKIEVTARRAIQSYLCHFLQLMPPSFDLRGASIGNLILVGGYLKHGRELATVLTQFGMLLQTRGQVQLICTEDLHLVATLQDGSKVVGQRQITGKEVPPLPRQIKAVYLAHLDQPETPVIPEISSDITGLIKTADSLCYAPGSFYSSLIANLLPRGVAQAISENPSPKYFLPSLGEDPECPGISVGRRVEILLSILRRECGTSVPVDKLLNYVLIDKVHSRYGGGVDADRIRDLGIRIIEADLTTARLPKLYDPQMTCTAMLELIQR